MSSRLRRLGQAKATPLLFWHRLSTRWHCVRRSTSTTAVSKSQTPVFSFHSNTSWSSPHISITSTKEATND